MVPDFIYSPEISILAFFVFIFVVIFEVSSRILSVEKGPVIIITFVISVMSVYYLYVNDFYGYLWLMPWVIGLLVAGLFLKIIWAFAKHGKLAMFG